MSGCSVSLSIGEHIEPTKAPPWLAANTPNSSDCHLELDPAFGGTLPVVLGFVAVAALALVLFAIRIHLGVIAVCESRNGYQGNRAILLTAV